MNSLLYARDLLVAIIVMVGAASAAVAGPFGLEMGMSKAQIEKLIGTQLAPNNLPGSYNARKLPKSHPSFILYGLLISETMGLCKIYATGILSTDRYGTELKKGYYDLVSQLEQKYGTPSDSKDYVMKGSPWDQPEEWMTSLRNEHRFLDSYWSRYEKGTLPDQLDWISLKSGYSSDSSGSLVLGYEFENFRKCIAELKKARSDPL